MLPEKVLITGGAGFIGSHLAEQLLNRGCQVTVIDNLATGQRRNLRTIKDRPGFRVMLASVAERGLLEQEIPRHSLVYHLASAVGVQRVMDRPVQAVETTFHATARVLRACAKHRRSVLVTSTSEVYGKSEDLPFREDADVVIGPPQKRRWSYACAKALDEFLALAHHQETGLPVFVVRLFNTVGPRQTGRYGMVLPTFVGQALQGGPITVYGDGQQRRCFCSVHDIVAGLIQLPQTARAVGQVVNLGSQEEVTMIQLAQRVKELCGSGSPIQLVPYERAYGAGFEDMRRRVPDLSRARELIGWNPRLGLDEIIAEVARHMQQDLRRGRPKGTRTGPSAAAAGRRNRVEQRSAGTERGEA
jgi:UDP-glucose 4-epimerase